MRVAVATAVAQVRDDVIVQVMLSSRFGPAG
jgi:hypothetical protein